MDASAKGEQKGESVTRINKGIEGPPKSLLKEVDLGVSENTKVRIRYLAISKGIIANHNPAAPRNRRNGCTTQT
jgi:hypothetical protein